MARVGLYTRRSSPGEDDKNFSLDNQEHAIRDWAACEQHTIVQIFHDPGGKSTTLSRPVLQKAFAAAKRGEFDILAVWRYDRFSRKAQQQAQAIYQLEGYGCEVVSITEPIMSGPLGDLMRMLYGVTSELEREGIVSRFYTGRMRRTEAGSLPGAPYPLYGYRHADRGDGTRRGEKNARYVADVESIDRVDTHAPAAVVRLIFQLALGGYTLLKIVAALEAEHVPTPSQVLEARGQLPRGKPVGHHWSTSTVSRILTNPAYKGEYAAWRYTKAPCERLDPAGNPMLVERVITRSDDDENVMLLPGAVQPLVSPEDWQAARFIAERNREQNPRRAKDPTIGLLRYGFARCGYCGRVVQVKPDKAHNGPRYRYCCSTTTQHNPELRHACPVPNWSWRVDEVDTLVWDWVQAQFKRPEFLREKFEEWKALQAEGQTIEQDRLATIGQLIDRAARRKTNFMARAGDAEDEAMSREYHALALQAVKEEAAFVAERAQLRQTLEDNAGLDRMIETLEEASEVVAANLADANYHDKRTVLWELQVQVEIRKRTDPEALRISWQLDPGGEVLTLPTRRSS